MSDFIKHECGIAFLRLRKPLDFYIEKYGSPIYGLLKMQILMNKQLNRGQDGAGVATIKLNPEFGCRYIARERSKSKYAVSDVFGNIFNRYTEIAPEIKSNITELKKEYAFAGEVILGHLRYGTHGKHSIESVHPFLRQNNWMSRNLVLAGNYNMTNVKEMYQQLIDLGQQPKEISDNVTMLEKIGHFLDQENERLFRQFREETSDNLEIASLIKENLSLENVLKNSFKNVDGGYNMIGLIGDGNAFIVRDQFGIRPNYYYANDEVVVCASERPAIQAAFNLSPEEVKEVKPGHALIVKRDGNYYETEILKSGVRKSCSFERIYFSRGSDAKIQGERKELGAHLAKRVLKACNHDFRNVVFSYVPNTAITCFYGLVDGLNKYLDKYRREAILKLGPTPEPKAIDKILQVKIRRENLLVKDAKIRTFITQDDERIDLVGNGYDVTQGLIKKGQDTIVVVDDSIVRGTTLKQSILRILDQLGPKKIIIASSAPLIKYPDCYGIDMSRMNDFIAFQAALSLLQKTNNSAYLQEVYQQCKNENEKPIAEIDNKVKLIYDLFTDAEIEKEVALLCTPEGMNAELEIVFQSVSDLHASCPNHLGDWYFTGDYPTPGGNKVVNLSFIYFIEGSNERAY